MFGRFFGLLIIFSRLSNITPGNNKVRLGCSTVRWRPHCGSKEHAVWFLFEHQQPVQIKPDNRSDMREPKPRGQNFSTTSSLRWFLA
jgi:hypothetical protein